MLDLRNRQYKNEIDNETLSRVEIFTLQLKKLKM